jgi:hypothetical protein
VTSKNRVFEHGVWYLAFVLYQLFHLAITCLAPLEYELIGMEREFTLICLFH